MKPHKHAERMLELLTATDDGKLAWVKPIAPQSEVESLRAQIAECREALVKVSAMNVEDEREYNRKTNAMIERHANQITKLQQRLAEVTRERHANERLVDRLCNAVLEINNKLEACQRERDELAKSYVTELDKVSNRNYELRHELQAAKVTVWNECLTTVEMECGVMYHSLWKEQPC